MNLFSKGIYNKLNKIIQLKINNRNRAALETLKSLGFSMPLIRTALLRLNRIEVSKISKGINISAVNIYNTINENRHNQQAMKVVSKSLDLKVNELFPREP